MHAFSSMKIGASSLTKVTKTIPFKGFSEHSIIVEVEQIMIVNFKHVGITNEKIKKKLILNMFSVNAICEKKITFEYTIYTIKLRVKFVQIPFLILNA